MSALYDIERATAVKLTASNDLKHLVKEAHDQGWDISKIARAAGVSRTTIYQWLKEEK